MKTYKHRFLKDLAATADGGNGDMFWEKNSTTVFWVGTGPLRYLHYTLNSFTDRATIDVTGSDSLYIDHGYYDRTNGLFYLTIKTVDPVCEKVYKVMDTSPYTVTQLGDLTLATDDSSSASIIVGADTEIYVFKNELDDDTSSHKLEVFKWVDPNWVSQDSDALTYIANHAFSRISHPINVGNDIYFLVYDVIAASPSTHLAKYSGGVLTHDVVDYTAYVFSNLYYGGLWYDGNDYLLFCTSDAGDGDKYKRIQYQISTTTSTIGSEYKIRIMSNDMVISGDMPKGFDYSNFDIYEYKSGHNPPQPYKIDDLTNADTPPQTSYLGSISENYIIERGMNNKAYVWKLTDVSSEINFCNIKYKMGKLTTCTFTSEIKYDYGEVVRFYDDSDVLLFFGKIYEKKYQSTTYEYKCLGLDKEMNNLKISYSPTNVDLNDAVEAVLDNCSYLYYSGSITANAIEITAEFKNKTIREILDIMADLGDFIWYVAPDGKVYFNDGTTDTGNTIVKDDGIMSSIPDVKEIAAQINYVKIFGGFVSGVRLTGTDEDIESQQLHGLIRYIDHYPHITNQTQLNAIAAAILARSGIADNPIYIRVDLSGLEFEQIGERMNIAFAPFSLTAADYHALENDYDALRDVGFYTFSSGIVHNWRGYGASTGVKTKTADEEQLDILGAEVLTNATGVATNVTNLAAHEALDTQLEYDDDDPAAYDITQANLTVDSAWHECDLDTYKTVPADAIGFVASVGLADTSGKILYAYFRDTSQSNDKQVSKVGYYSAHADASRWIMGTVFIPLDSNHKFDYLIYIGVETLNITVLWWIRRQT